MNERKIFSEALQISDLAERAAYLEKACGHDGEKRRRIEELLAEERGLGNFLESPAVAVAMTAEVSTLTERLGSQIGPYKIREQLGEGGMGAVYVAEQTEPVKRKVALKIIKPGMDSRDVLARFEAERQALAMMEHPNIAKVYDGGTTEFGQPYFVMELVCGIPLTEYCDEHMLTTEERLEVFLKVCRAVQHAHQKGVIHRDLKPSNVLVASIDGDAVPKVIDFGVAKAAGPKLTEETVYTQISQLVGTPIYMSPEQVELGVADIDTRSDVYSLGVLLYELLTGHTPFDSDTLKDAGFDEMRRIIREDDPPRPSDCLSTLNAQASTTLAGLRSSNFKHLSNALKGELDWIVMKALEKDRNRRYESASVLADDVERHLADEPVTARPASSWYRIQKFVRRNRALVASSAVVLITLAVGLALSMTALLHAVQQRELARQSAEQASQAEAEAQKRADELAITLGEKESVLEDNSVFISLLSDMYPRPFLRVNPGKTRTIYEFIEETTREINDNGRLSGHPLVEIEIRRIFANAYFSAHEFDKFRDHLNKALVLAKQEHGEDSLIVAEIHRRLAYEIAIKGPSASVDPKTVLEHAEEAIRIYGLHKQEKDSFHAWVGKTYALNTLDRLEEAKVAGEKTVEIEELIDKYPTWSYVDLGQVLQRMGKLDQALVCCENAIVNYELLERGNPHPALTANLLRHKASCLRQMYRLDEAQETYREGYELVQTPDLLTEPQRHSITLGLADVHFALGKVDEAFRLVDQTEQICRDNDVTYWLIQCLDLKGWLYFQLGDYKAAARVFEEATARASSREMMDDPKMNDLFGRPCARLALTYQALGEKELAVGAYKEVRPLTKYFVDESQDDDSRVEDYPCWVHARGILAEDDPQQLDKANSIYVTAFEKVKHSKDYHHEARQAAYDLLHAMIQRRQNPENLDSVIAKLTDDLRKVTEPRATYANERNNMVPTDRWQIEAKLVELLLEADRKRDALKVMQDALQVRRDCVDFGDAHIQTLLAQIRLGEFVIHKEAYGLVPETYDEAAELENAYEQLPGSSHVRGVRRQVAGLLIDAYQRRSDTAKTEHWRETLEELSQDAHEAPRSQEQETL
jgi:serine/threonine protein kinase